jgi:four helix bundle protein
MGNGVDRFEDLDVWKLADELRREVLEFTNKGLAAKDFKFRDQIRDATSSAARNTAEGFGRFNPGEFARFLGFAHASLNETQDQLLDGRERGYIDQALFDRLWILSKRALGANTSLMKYLKDCAAKGRKPWLGGGNDLPKRERTTRKQISKQEAREPGNG